jgi:hypothetical protein
MQSNAFRIELANFLSRSSIARNGPMLCSDGKVAHTPYAVFLI